MTGLPPQPSPAMDARASTEVVRFTARGERALDELAAVITHRMARTPAGIAHALATLYETPVDDLVAALDAVAGRLAAEAPESGDTPRDTRAGTRACDAKPAHGLCDPSGKDKAGRASATAPAADRTGPVA